MPAVRQKLPIIVFLTVSLSLVTALSTAAAPAIEVEFDKLDLGKVSEGTVAEGVFRLHNTGDEPLVIERVQVSCKCVAVKDLSADQLTIPAGGSLDMTVTYDTAERIGAQKADVVVTSNDPERPALLLRIDLTIEVLVQVRPPEVRWGRAIRGGAVDTVLRLNAGAEGQGIDLVEMNVKNPNVVATVEKTTEDGKEVLLVRFALDANAPLGGIETELEATMRIGDKTYGVLVPVSGLVLGDVISSPPLVAALRVPVYPGARISEFTVRPSGPGGAIQVIKTVVTGPIRTEIVRDDDASRVQVFAAKDAPAGPQGCLVEIYTTSLDQPVIKAPVYVLMAGPVAVTPDYVVLDSTASDEASGTQEVTLRAISSLQMRVVNAVAESDHLQVEIATPEQTDPEHPAMLRIKLAPKTALDAPEATVIVVETDQPGGKTVRIPVLIRSGKKGGSAE